MKRMLALLLPVTAVLAACGGPQDGLVNFYGVTPNTSLQRDSREVKLQCPRCKDAVTLADDWCPKGQKVCETQIQWKDDYACQYCGETGVCQACINLEQDAGKCYNCRGSGLRIYLGKTVDCPNCKASGKCPVCKGSRKCDMCTGSGRVEKSTVGTLAEKAGGGAPAAEENP